MSKMKDLDTRLENLENKLDNLLHLMRDMVLLEGKIERLEEKIDGQIKTLLDRVVEMSMVQQGQPGEANVHRAQARLDNDFSNPQSWTEDKVEEDVWPPPNCDVVGING